MQYPTLEQTWSEARRSAPLAMIRTRNECCSSPFAIENCHIFRLGLCENTFNMSAAVLADIGSDKVRNYFRSNNTRWGIAV